MGAPCHTYIFFSLSALKKERGGARELFPFGAGVKMHLRLTAARVRV